MNGIGRGDGNQKKDKPAIFTRETAGMILLLFSALIFLFTAAGPYIAGEIGLAIAAFFIGFTGFFSYPLLLLGMYGGFVLTFGKKLIPRRWLLRSSLVVLCIFMIVHTATSERFFFDAATASARGYGPYLAGCWGAASVSVAEGTGGGVLFGLIAYPVRFLLSEPGAYIVYAVLTLLSVFYLLLLTPLKARFRPVAREPRAPREQERERGMSFDELEDRPRATVPEPERQPAPAPRAQAPAAEPEPEPYRSSRDILFSNDPAANYRANLIYDRDSAFNRSARRSSVQPASRSQTPESYTGSFSRDAETARDPMPKRVTSEEFNYPERPTYRAPDEPSAPRPEPVQQEYSSAPNVFDDLPDESEPVRPTYRAEAEPPKAPAPAEDVRPEPPAPPRRTLRVGFGDSDEPEARSFPDPSPDTERMSFDFGRRDALGGLDRRADPFDDGLSRRGDDPLGDGLSRGRDEPLDDGLNRRRDDSLDEGLSRRGDPFDDSLNRRRDDSLDDGLSRRGDPFDDSLSRRGDDPLDEGLSRRGEDLFGGDRASDDGLSRSSAASLLDDDAPLPEEPRSERVMRSVSPDPATPAPPPKKKKHVWKRYKRPDVELLNTYEDRTTLTNEEIGRNSGIILDTLRRFKIETHIIGVKGGASVTRYDLAMPESGTISNITRYDEELALYLMVKGVNMYPNPEVRGISVEVPNEKRATVGLKSILQSEEFQKNDPEALLFALGQDVEGRSVCGNVTDMTHILVAGMTGSGKSITMHAMLISMLFKYSPEELRLILIDPKQSEFTLYEGIPHLMINEIITQAPKAVTALNWAIKEMERRYTLFNEKTRAGIAVSKLDEYNQNLNEDEERLPKIVIVVDEFSDLMMTAKKDVEERIQRLAQKARAAGIHLVLATQRPDATVITGVIKSNLPTRIALSVDSDLNSRIMLDESGAEKLLGHGDMLIKTAGKPRRAQGAYISPAERQRVVNFIRENNETYFDSDVSDYINKTGDSAGDAADASPDGGDLGGAKEMYIRALAIVVKLGQASISLIQRKCSVGYNHAGKIIEWMESMGYISPFDGKAKARTVLLTPEEFNSKYGGDYDL